jgi:hypothetical protein
VKSHRAALAAVPDLVTGAAYLLAWAAPAILGAGVVSWLIVVIELEAVALLGAHAVALSLIIMMSAKASMRDRLFGGLILAGMIGFAATEAWRHHYWWPATALGLLLANRLASLFTGRLATEEVRMQLMYDGLMALGVYVLAIGITFYVAIPSPGGPLGALPPEHARWCAVPADLVRRFFESRPSGSWCAEPVRALAGGGLYFFASAVRTFRRGTRA